VPGIKKEKKTTNISTWYDDANDEWFAK
jgi:hypothetical protein